MHEWHKVEIIQECCHLDRVFKNKIGPTSSYIYTYPVEWFESHPPFIELPPLKISAEPP